jgi:hypothetical protein
MTDNEIEARDLQPAQEHGDTPLVLDNKTLPPYLRGSGGDAGLADCGDSCHKSLLPELSGVMEK